MSPFASLISIDSAGYLLDLQIEILWYDLEPIIIHFLHRFLFAFVGHTEIWNCESWFQEWFTFKYILMNTRGTWSRRFHKLLFQKLTVLIKLYIKLFFLGNEINIDLTNDFSKEFFTTSWLEKILIMLILPFWTGQNRFVLFCV